MWYLLAFVENNRIFSIGIITVFSYSVSLIVSSFLIVNYYDPSFEYLSPMIALIVAAGVFIGLWQYTGSADREYAEMLEEEKSAIKQGIDITKCGSCMALLETESYICPSCGYDNTKLIRNVLS